METNIELLENPTKEDSELLIESIYSIDYQRYIKTKHLKTQIPPIKNKSILNTNSNIQYLIIRNESNKIIAFCSISKNQNLDVHRIYIGIPIIHKIWYDDKFNTDNKLAKLFIPKILEFIKTNNISTILTSIGSYDYNLLSFYKKQGFKKIQTTWTIPAIHIKSSSTSKLDYAVVNYRSDKNIFVLAKKQALQEHFNIKSISNTNIINKYYSSIINHNNSSIILKIDNGYVIFNIHSFDIIILSIVSISKFNNMLMCIKDYASKVNLRYKNIIYKCYNENNRASFIESKFKESDIYLLKQIK